MRIMDIFFRKKGILPVSKWTFFSKKKTHRSFGVKLNLSMTLGLKILPVTKWVELNVKRRNKKVEVELDFSFGLGQYY